jgi:hypothetical protein
MLRYTQLGGSAGCIGMILFSLLASLILTLLINVLISGHGVATSSSANRSEASASVIQSWRSAQRADPLNVTLP